jgi:hypothetical protein
VALAENRNAEATVSVAATPSAAASANETATPDELEDATVSAAVEDEPVFPDEETEMAMRSELRARGEAVVAAARTSVDEGEVAAPLPPLDSLVGRLRPEVREVLDELFRARFTSVRRVPAQALKDPVLKNKAG